MLNDATGSTRSPYADVANPQNFTGPFLFAPGGDAGQDQGVDSAGVEFNNSLFENFGTSQAAPHVAGYYAVIKQFTDNEISVADGTTWIEAIGSIPITVNLPFPVGNTTFRRVRVPNSIN